MSAKETSSGPGKPKTDAELRAARMKAALKSNMGRRKAQARARKVAETSEKEE